uniref:Ribosomal protein L21 n=1 Tax=Panagrolaimus superbus TaxID=310955 RepID=A0A914YBH5_9BILA
MPGATLYIEKNVEIHIWPNVRILVLGNLIADATLWQPIRFLPLNVTEALEEKGKIGTRYKRSILKRPRHRILSDNFKHSEFIRKKRRQVLKTAPTV